MKLTVAWYNVADLDVAKRFYSETLGLKPTFEMQGWAEFANSPEEAAIGLYATGDSGAQKAQGATVVLQVEDLASTMGELQRKGVSFEGEVQEIPGVVKIATFHDPFGNRLQMVQPLFKQPN
jgi:predicted enzyme related to lactoylglutathione lyase